MVAKSLILCVPTLRAGLCRDCVQQFLPGQLVDSATADLTQVLDEEPKESVALVDGELGGTCLHPEDIFFVWFLHNNVKVLVEPS